MAEHIGYLDARIEWLNADIAAASAPLFADQIAIVMSMPGVERASAEVIVAEISGDVPGGGTGGRGDQSP